jgi:hypothetical protein
LFGGADKDNMAGEGFFGLMKLADLDGATVRSFILNGDMESVAERICAEDADDDGALRGGEAVGGPFNELGEAKELNGFDLVFLGDLGTGGKRNRAESEKKQAKASGPPPMRRMRKEMASERVH